MVKLQDSADKYIRQVVERVLFDAHFHTISLRSPENFWNLGGILLLYGFECV